MAQSGKEEIRIDGSVAGMQLGDPNFVGTYKKVAGKVGEAEAIRLYSGMSEGKSAYILKSGPRLDTFSVRWTLPRLQEIVSAGYLTRNQAQQHEMLKHPEEYCYGDDLYGRDEFYGPKDTVTYARWLYNRYGEGRVAKHFHIPEELALLIGESDIPGGTKVASIESEEDIYEIEDRIADRHEAAYRNLQNQKAFREYSRKMKIRMNRMMEIPEIYVLRKLIDAEEVNINAKNCHFDYVDYNYEQKSLRLREAIGKLPETGWKYWWQDDGDGVADHIFYVELPGGVQVSWHGMERGDVAGVPEDEETEWDGEVASTLPKLAGCVQRICPSIMDEKFSRKKCVAEVLKYFGR